MRDAGGLRTERGQHTLEFAILIGLATLAAVTMQFAARRGLQGGVRALSDSILGPPPPPKPPGQNEPQTTVQVQRCGDLDNPGAVVTATGSDLVVQAACANTTEIGMWEDYLIDLRRLTITTEERRGASVNEDARLQVRAE